MDPHQYCVDLVRRQDKDRFLGALFAPPEGRRHLLALYAFNVEIGRVREMVRDPLPGEVRLQWWRDMLGGTAHGDAEAHPVAAALAETMSVCRLPREPFLRLIDARALDLYDEPVPTLNELEGYCGETASALFQLGAIALAGGRDPGTGEAAGHAGVAYAVTGLLRAVPLHASRGQILVPLDVLEAAGADPRDILAGCATEGVRAALAEMRRAARGHLARFHALCRTIPPGVMPAFLPLSLADLYLARMERPDYDPFRTPVDVPQWRRQWRLWRRARKAGTARRGA